VTYRTTAALALIAAGAMTLVAACGGTSSSGSSSGTSAGGPVHGGNLVIARTADSQSMNNTTLCE